MLNFKGWEKVSEDKATTTLKHEKGHTMTLAHKKLPKIQQEALKRLKLADGTEKGTVGDQAQADQQQPATNININAGAQPAAGQPQSPDAAQLPTSYPVNVPQMPQTQSPVTNGEFNPQAALTNANKAQGVLGQVGAAQAQVNQAQAEEQARLHAVAAQQYQDNLKEWKGHSLEMVDAMNKGMINPNAYMENMSTGKKVSTALGLLLGGAGSGLAGGENPAYDFLNKQIDRDISAQKDRQGQRNTIWGYYRNLYGDENAATALTRATMNDYIAAKANATTAKLGTPTAQANNAILQSNLAADSNKHYLDSQGILGTGPNMRRIAQTSQQSGQQANQPVNNQQSGFVGAVGSNQPGEQAAVAGSAPSSNLVDRQESPIGAPPAQAMSPKQGVLEPDDFADSPILFPNANDVLHSDVQYGPSAARADYVETGKQFAKAQRADRILEQLGPVMSKLDNLAKEGGSVGYVRRHDPFSAIPYVGTAIHKVVAEPVSATPTNKLYDSYKTRITNDVLGALKGTEVTADQVREAVENNLPERKDPPELVAQKERNIRLFIKNALDTSLLQTYGMSAKEKVKK